MDGKILNPIYSMVAENVLTEQAIAKEKIDLFSFSLGLYCDFIQSKPFLSENIKLLEKGLVDEGYKPKSIAAMAVCSYLAKKYNIGLSKEFHSNCDRLITSVHEIEVPLSIKIYTYYFSNLHRDININKLKLFLIDRRQELISQNNFASLIEVEFSLGKDYFSEKLWRDSEDLINAFDISKLSKLTLLLKQLNNPEWEKYLSLIEKRCQEKLSQASLPLISLLIFEAEKLISTNLPTDKLNELLESLKVKNRNWARLISDIQQSGITLDLNQLNRISGLDVEDSCWALIVLENTGRKETYQMTDQDKDNLRKYSELLQEKVKLIPLNAVKNYLFYGFLCMVLALVYFDKIGIGQLQCILSGKCQYLNIKIAPDQLGDLISLPIATIMFLKYFYYSWRYLISNRKFDLKAVLISIISIRPAG